MAVHPLSQRSVVRYVRQIPLWQPLAQHDFLLVWLGQSVSQFGDQFHFVALVWLTLHLTGSGLALGTVLMAAAIPRAVLMLVGGAISDRFSARSITLASNASRAVIVAVISGLIFLHLIQLWHLYVLAVAFGLFDAFFYPAIGRFVPLLLGAAHMRAGNALMQGSAQMSVFIGPAVAGIVVAAAGTGPAFAIDAGTFVFATITLWLMRPGEPDKITPTPTTSLSDEAATPNPERQESLLATMRAGLVYAWSDPILRIILVIIAAIDFSFGGPISVGLAVLTSHGFHMGSAALGLLFSGWGGGSLLGLLIGGSIKAPRRLGLILIGDTAVLGLGLALIGVAPTVLAATATLGVMGLASGFLNVVGISWLQVRTESRMLGRVMSLVMLASAGLGPVSYLLAGSIVEKSSTALFVGAGALVFLTAVLGATSRTLRTSQ